MKYCFLLITLFYLASCASQNNNQDVDQTTSYLQKSLIVPFDDFTVTTEGLTLLSKNGILPGGYYNITCFFSIGDNSYYADFQCKSPYFSSKEWNFLSKDSVSLIQFASDSDDLDNDIILERGDTLFEQKLDWFLNTFNQATEYSVTICFDMDAHCFNYLPSNSQTGKAAFTRHFTQRFSSDKEKELVLNYPFIQLNKLVYFDLLKKGLIDENDVVWSNYFLIDWSQTYHNVNRLRSVNNIFVKKKDEDIRVYQAISRRNQL